MDAKWKSQVQERLLSLYLRLNGFFVTGFIVHSPIEGQNLAEIDLLAVRFPHNREPEREVEADPYLQTSNEVIDLVICEAKSSGKQLQFNQALLASPDRVACLLRWAGIYQEQEVLELAPRFLAALSPTNPPRNEVPCVVGPQQTRVRGLLCCPERDMRRDNQAWFLTGSAMLGFISRCLCPSAPRLTCATTYDFGLWGQHEGIVRYIKDRGPEKFGTVKDLYAYLASPGKNQLGLPGW
jgi:hypothetical protein